MSLPILNGPPPKTAAQRERRVTGLVAGSLLLAWAVGGFIGGDSLGPAFSEAMPDADRFEALDDRMSAAWDGDRLLGHVAAGEGDGYGGPLTVAAAVDGDGVVTALVIADHKETPAYMELVQESRLFETLLGTSWDRPPVLGQDVDAVSGATTTARAVVDATVGATRAVSAGPLGIELPSLPPPSIVIGAPELVLALLFAVGFAGRKKGAKYKRELRLASLAIAFVAIGFWLNLSLTIAQVSAFLLGYWPQWQTHVYWYLLVGGVLLVAVVDGRNSYCNWFCPFGAAQDCLGAIGGAKSLGPPKWRRRFIRIQRWLAWLAVVLALLLRNPGVSSFEIFGTLFALTGSSALFAILGIILVMSMFVKQPFCHYLCPIDPMFDLIAALRRSAKHVWLTARTRLTG